MLIGRVRHVATGLRASLKPPPCRRVLPHRQHRHGYGHGVRQSSGFLPSVESALEYHFVEEQAKKGWPKLRLACRAAARHSPTHAKRAEELFQMMENRGVTVDTASYNSLIWALSQAHPPDTDNVMLILARMLELSSTDPSARPDIVTLRNVVCMYMKLNEPSKAGEVFGVMSQLGVKADYGIYETLLLPGNATMLWQQFVRDEVPATYTVISLFIKCFLLSHSLNKACEVWEFALRNNVVPQPGAMRMLLDALAAKKLYGKALRTIQQTLPLALAQPLTHRPWPNVETLAAVVRYVKLMKNKTEMSRLWETLIDPATFNIAPTILQCTYQISIIGPDVDRAFNVLEWVLERESKEAGFINNDFVRMFESEVLRRNQQPQGRFPAEICKEAYEWAIRLPPNMNPLSPQHLEEFTGRVSQWKASATSNQVQAEN